jgi:hypothetical protein
LAAIQPRTEKKKPELVLLGEHYHGSAREVSRVQRAGRFTHIFDFPLAFALRDSYCQGKSPGQIGATLFDDRQHVNASRLVTFLDNHDLPRILSLCGDKVEPVRHALTTMFALRGIPALTYGTEVGLKGKDENSSRGDMVFPDGTEPLYRHIRNLLRLRKKHPVLVGGRTKIVSFDNRVLGVLRSGKTESALLLVNGRSEAARYRLPKGLRNRSAHDALTGSPLGNEIELRAGQTRLLLFPSQPAIQARATGTRRVVLTVKPAGKPVVGALVVAGSGIELGDWRIQKAKALTMRPNGSFELSINLPLHGLFAFKLANRGGSGKIQWESGDNRYLFVPPGESPLRVKLQWRN